MKIVQLCFSVWFWSFFFCPKIMKQKKNKMIKLNETKRKNLKTKKKVGCKSSHNVRDWTVWRRIGCFATVQNETHFGTEHFFMENITNFIIRWYLNEIVCGVGRTQPNESGEIVCGREWCWCRWKSVLLAEQTQRNGLKLEASDVLFDVASSYTVLLRW